MLWDLEQMETLKTYDTTTSKSATLHVFTKDEKYALGLINVGTFLEYFDFCTYLHIAVVLNGVFFPKSDSYTKSLLIALSFSMAYVLRPIGSLIFGLWGDLRGRKQTIILTTSMMAFSSLVLAFLPTYDQIGFKASCIVLLCRMIQGISSGVEFTGARIYVTELTEKYHPYFYTAIVGAVADAGALFSLAICSLMLWISPNHGWRGVFFLGAGIAIVSAISRTKLKESPEFLEKLKKFKEFSNQKKALYTAFKENLLNTICYFLMELIRPFLGFTFLIYMGQYLSLHYGYTPEQIVRHNFFITLVSFAVHLFFIFLTRYIHPIKILKFTTIVLFFLSLALPFLIKQSTTIFDIFVIQVICWSLNVTSIGSAIFVKGFPTIGRFTMLGFSFSFARAIGAVATSYGCIWLAEKYSFAGISILMTSMVILYGIGLHFFLPDGNRSNKEGIV